MKFNKIAFKLCTKRRFIFLQRKSQKLFIGEKKINLQIHLFLTVLTQTMSSQLTLAVINQHDS